jgi:hypothetical protein
MNQTPILRKFLLGLAVLIMAVATAKGHSLLPSDEDLNGIIAVCTIGQVQSVQRDLEAKIRLWKGDAEAKGQVLVNDLSAILDKIPDNKDISPDLYRSYSECIKNQASKFLIKHGDHSESLREADVLLRRLERLDENQMRQEFDFENIIRVNTKWAKAQYASSAFGKKVNISDYIRPGMTLKNLSQQLSDMKSSAALDDNDKSRALLIVSTNHLRTAQKYRSFVEEGDFPDSLRLTIAELLQTVDENLTILWKVINNSIAEFPQKYKTLNDLDRTDTWIYDRYAKEYKDLKPESSSIVVELKKYLATQ